MIKCNKRAYRDRQIRFIPLPLKMMIKVVMLNSLWVEL